MADWNQPPFWHQQLERRLFELGAMVKGNLPIQADRIADVVEITEELRKEIEVLRKELTQVHERQDKMAEFIKAHVKKENGGAT